SPEFYPTTTSPNPLTMVALINNAAPFLLWLCRNVCPSSTTHTHTHTTHTHTHTTPSNTCTQTTLNIHKHSLSPLFSLIHRQTYKDVHTHTHTHTIIHIEYSQKHSHTPSFFLGFAL